MRGRPRFGLFGLAAFPYFLVFELFGPLIQLIGLPVTLYAYFTGRLSLGFVIGFLVVSVFLGILLSVAPWPSRSSASAATSGGATSFGCSSSPWSRTSATAS